ncbi:CPBP family intramembrane glutamic endopeptidase [Sphingomonas sp.]|uniref:CPBP family intramembrane glutamic endopeptidase n=1 Tax=Sphingomonas sp. TaxID=28214 RepID=UPI0025EEB117|nr:CPBP family intramembrane glutamic endopeptidase [Sphingomonas sp.]
MAADRIERRARHPGAELGIAMAFVGVTLVALSLVARVLPPAWHEGVGRIVLGALAAAAFVAMYVAFCRIVERRPPRELVPAGAAIELGAGLAIGLVLFSTVVAAIWALGGYRVIGHNGMGVLPPVIGMVLVSAIPEEIVFRGLFFRLIERWLGSGAALALSAALFGAMHLLNPGATWLAAVAIALEAGVMLAALYMLTRRLWAAIGVHAAWNFAQGGIYGIAVSGNATRGLLVPAPSDASPLVTGGAFGAEASLPAIVVATAFGAAMLWLAWRRGCFVGRGMRTEPLS